MSNAEHQPDPLEAPGHLSEMFEQDAAAPPAAAWARLEADLKLEAAPRRRYPIWWLAAGIAVTVGAGSLWLSEQGQENETPVAVSSTSTKQSATSPIASAPGPAVKSSEQQRAVSDEAIETTPAKQVDTQTKPHQSRASVANDQPYTSHAADKATISIEDKSSDEASVALFAKPKPQAQDRIRTELPRKQLASSSRAVVVESQGKVPAKAQANPHEYPQNTRSSNATEDIALNEKGLQVSENQATSHVSVVSNDPAQTGTRISPDPSPTQPASTALANESAQEALPGPRTPTLQSQPLITEEPTLTTVPLGVRPALPEYRRTKRFSLEGHAGILFRGMQGTLSQASVASGERFSGTADVKPGLSLGLQSTMALGHGLGLIGGLCLSGWQESITLKQVSYGQQLVQDATGAVEVQSTRQTTGEAKRNFNVALLSPTVMIGYQFNPALGLSLGGGADLVLAGNQPVRVVPAFQAAATCQLSQRLMGRVGFSQQLANGYQASDFTLRFSSLTAGIMLRLGK